MLADADVATNIITALATLFVAVVGAWVKLQTSALRADNEHLMAVLMRHVQASTSRDTVKLKALDSISEVAKKVNVTVTDKLFTEIASLNKRLQEVERGLANK